MKTNTSDTKTRLSRYNVISTMILQHRRLIQGDRGIGPHTFLTKDNPSHFSTYVYYMK